MPVASSALPAPSRLRARLILVSAVSRRICAVRALAAAPAWAFVAGAAADLLMSMSRTRGIERGCSFDSTRSHFFAKDANQRNPSATDGIVPVIRPMRARQRVGVGCVKRSADAPPVARLERCVCAALDAPYAVGWMAGVSRVT